VTAGWVAATVRGRALLGRTIGAAGALEIAEADSWVAARDRLATTMYGTGLPAGADRAAARRHAAATTAWQLRVLAGWLPPGAAGLARLAAAPIELADVERRLAQQQGADPIPPIPLGPLASVGTRLSRAGSGAEVRQLLARSVWGDPGGDDPTSIAIGMRVAWARRVARASTAARPWALGAIATLVARERFAFDRPIADTTAREIDVLLGRAWRAAGDVGALGDRLHDRASWPLEGVTDPGALWRSELRVIDRIARDADDLAESGRATASVVIAILALLLVDLWRVSAAVEAAATGTGSEVLGAVAA
jgi:hypothetical protein